MAKSSHAVVLDQRKDPFARVSVELIDRYASVIGCNALAVYLILARYANRTTHKTFVGHPVIAAHLNMGVRTVQRAIDVLIEEHLILYESRPGKTSVYTLIDLPHRKSTDSAPLFDAPDDPTSTPTPAKLAYLTDMENQGVPESISYEEEAKDPGQIGVPKNGLTPATVAEPTELTPAKSENDPGQICADPGQIVQRNKEEPAFNQRRTNQIKTTTTSAMLDRSRISKLLSQVCPNFDPPVLDRMVQGILRERPDARTEEVLHWLAVKGAQSSARGIKNPSGFLIKEVPECFAGEVFEMWRANLRAVVETAATAVEVADVEAAAQRKWAQANRHKLFPKGNSASAGAP